MGYLLGLPPGYVVILSALTVSYIEAQQTYSIRKDYQKIDSDPFGKRYGEQDWKVFDKYTLRTSYTKIAKSATYERTTQEKPYPEAVSVQPPEQDKSTVLKSLEGVGPITPLELKSTVLKSPEGEGRIPPLEPPYIEGKLAAPISSLGTPEKFPVPSILYPEEGKGGSSSQSGKDGVVKPEVKTYTPPLLVPSPKPSEVPGPLEGSSNTNGSHTGTAGTDAAGSHTGTAETDAAGSHTGTAGTDAAGSHTGTASTDAAGSHTGTAGTDAAGSHTGTAGTDAAGSHTGTPGTDAALAAAPPIYNKPQYPLKEDAKLNIPKDKAYIPTRDEVASWEKSYKLKQETFLKKYESKELSEVDSKIVSVDKDYYLKANISNDGLIPKKHFNLADHNVSKTDVGDLDYFLLDGEGSVDYKVMSRTPHGRHLLLITLLQDPTHPSWKPRCHGKVRMYLPASLKSPDQPPPSKGAIVLKDIVSKGQVVPRKELLEMLRDRPYSVFDKDASVSRFNQSHGHAVESLLNLTLSQGTFDSTLSFLVVMKDVVNIRLLVDVLVAVIGLRDDVGNIIPSLPSIYPFDYFPMHSLKMDDSNSSQYMESIPSFKIDTNATKYAQMNTRVKRQARPSRIQGGLGIGGTTSSRVWRITWGEGRYRTLPASDPESRLWYFREDPMVNGHHLHWHLKLSNKQVPIWHPSHGMNMDRRGEMFVFMHKQILCRYNADRLALGLPLTTALDSNTWRLPINPGYDSRLTESSGRPYPMRPNGARIPNVERLFMADNAIRQAIRNGVLTMTEGPRRMGYVRGVDIGISHLGNAMEAFPEHPAMGNLHNDGHEYIGRMHGNDGDLNVMGNPNGAVRDPLFYRWHKHIDDLVREYKQRLPAYGDEELNFPGVEITAAHVQSERGSDANNLFTYMDLAMIRLQSLDLRASDGSSVNIVHERLNHIPFTYHINIRAQVATQGLVRIFLIPANIRLPAGTDITQVSIEMDRFMVVLSAGDNYYSRHSSRSPFITKSPLSLIDLQERLVQGRISEDEFNWSACGWPETMVLPRGREGGMTFRLYIMVSQILPGDRALTANWQQMQFTSWSWCGVRRNEGDVPDSRPMGFPLDRAPPNGNWQSLMYRGEERRLNHHTLDVVINHDPVGTTRVRS